MDKQPEPQEQNQKPVVAPAPSARFSRLSSLLYSKRAWLIVGILVFLLGIGTLVPASKIPFLRNLAYAMGYTPDEISHLSFLKAFFSWHDHAKMVRGELPDPNEVSVFGEGGGFFASKSARAQNKLFDLRSVNASLSKKGRRRETVAGSSGRPEGEDRRASNIRVNNPDASANTQSNRAKTGDVFFGAEREGVARDKNDGFNSVNSLKKIKNPHIAGGASAATGMDRLIDKAVRADSQLENIAKGIDKSGSSLAQLGNIGSVGDSRAKRDMYYAWLTGRAARRTPQVVLKKTLATSGFNGAELPRTVFTASGFSGVGINPDDVVADMDSVQKYLEQDKDCQAAIAQGASAAPTLGEINALIQSLPNTFLNVTCENRATPLNNYRGQLASIRVKCVAMQQAYQNIQQGCATLSISLGRCETDKLPAYATAFDEYCTNELEACGAEPAEDPDGTWQACVNTAKSHTTNGTFTGNDAIPYTGSELPGDVNSTFKDGERLDTDYFPSVDWAHSLWVDENAGD